MIEITGSNGQVKTVLIDKFPALTGWNMQARFLQFAASSDMAFRTAFTMDVLSFARVQVGEREMPLSTDALIDNHLESWQNVQAVFEAVLVENGIDPSTHADKPHFWANAGAEMAVGFIAEASKLMGPAMELFERKQAEEKDE